MAELSDAGQVEVLNRLHSFLRSRCGSLKAAFVALDSSDQGHLTRSDFERGLWTLGFQENPSVIFSALDASKSGEIDLRTFMRGVQCEDSRETSSPVLKTRALLPPRCPSDGQMLPPTLLSRPPSQQLATPASKDSSAERPPSLEARVVQLEEQLSSEKSQRLQLELRLTQYLHKAISEEFDGLRRQLAEEQNQRQALRSELQTLRSRLLGQADMQDVWSRLRRMEEKLEHGRKSEDKKSSWAMSTTASSEDRSPPSTVMEAECEQMQLGHRAPSPVPAMKGQLTVRTLLRQENVCLREQMLDLRERAVEAKEQGKISEAIHAPKQWHRERSEVGFDQPQEAPALERASSQQKLEQAATPKIFLDASSQQKPEQAATPKVLPPNPVPTPAASPVLPRRSVSPCCVAPHASPKLESRVLTNDGGVIQMRSSSKGAWTPTPLLGGKGGPAQVNAPGGKGALPVYAMRPVSRLS